jgi:hypothetical protein
MVSVKFHTTLTLQLSTSMSVVLLEAKLGLVQAPLVSTTMFGLKSLPPYLPSCLNSSASKTCQPKTKQTIKTIIRAGNMRVMRLV